MTTQLTPLQKFYLFIEDKFGLSIETLFAEAPFPTSSVTEEELTAGLDLKAPIASPTFTGTVAGITKSMVGLGNVDNTADTSKPVSTAQQTALNLKADTSAVASALALKADASAVSNVNNTSDASKPVSTAQQTALDLKQNINVRSVLVTLTDAEIKALPTTAIAILAAPGAGKAHIFLSVNAVSSFAAGAYTNLNAGLLLRFLLNAAESSAVGRVRGTPAAGSFFGSTTLRYLPFTLPYTFDNGTDVNSGPDALTNWENGPLTISVNNQGSGNLTGGNAANTLKVFVAYLILNTTTGALE